MFPSRLRAYAVVRCLIDLSLRSSEVVKLQLDDINWAGARFKLVGTKSRRTEALPLPSAAGAAIAAYLHEERPTTKNRAIFVGQPPTTNRFTTKLQ
ncbi:phage integrase family protein [Mesorhizobium loti]|uniref:Phage integrase family protein n=1 Tax=Rhizobium loti TaxID=381 RepID=A0A8E2W574_RHILI|nr:tyrosine-type recombinase/integrase [Mesorhizobium loti]PWJ84081.1 phage integrase family protein [Mesorhizobium loti]